MTQLTTEQTHDIYCEILIYNGKIKTVMDMIVVSRSDTAISWVSIDGSWRRY